MHQGCLEAHGSYTDEITGRYDRATHAALVAFDDDMGRSTTSGDLAPNTWLLLGMWAVMRQLPVESDLDGAGAEEDDGDGDGDDRAPIQPLALRGVFLTSVTDGVGQLEVLVHNPNPDPVHHVRVEVLQEGEYNDETVDELAGNDAMTVTISADARPYEDGHITAFGQVRVACLDPATGTWTDAVEQEFNVGLDADGGIADTGTGASEGPHLTISGIDPDDEVTWAGDNGVVPVRITLFNNGETPVYDATLEIEQPVSGGGQTIVGIVQQNIMDVGAEEVEEVTIDVPRQHNEVPFHVKVMWASASGHETEHSIHHEFLLSWDGDGRVIGISAY